MNEKEKSLSIGDVARVTGISVYTLRQWERRYGYPIPLKLESGHRRYSAEQLSRLKLARKALDLGFRANQVAALPYEKLLELLQNHKDISSDDLVIEHWLKCVKGWDASKLTEYFYNDWRTLGPIGFVSERLSPFLKRVGEAWAQKEISISHEHFVSELLQSFLTKHWRAENQELSPDSFLLAALEGEEHSLGLHMCAVVLAAAQKKIVFLGTPTPVAEVISSAKSTPAKVVCLSFSSTYPAQQAIAYTKKIRSELPIEIDLIIGGDGAPSGIESVKNFSNLRNFYDWVQYERAGQEEKEV